MEFNRDVALNADLASMHYGTSSPEEIEDLRRRAFIRRTLLLWQWDFESPWWDTTESTEAITRQWRRSYTRSKFSDVWEQEKGYFNPSFVQYMEENVAN